MEKESTGSFGESLGAQMAYREDDLLNDPNDPKILESIRLYSDIYRNFATGGLKGFTADFDRGYALARRDIEVDQGADLSPASPETAAPNLG